MSNSKGSSNMRSLMYSGKHALLPPKSPFPSLSPSYVDYAPNPPVAAKAVQRPREGHAHHQRTSSESFLMEEQPSWLDDLLNEPETPVRKGGHRRSSSDSFAYIDVGSINSLDYVVQGDNKCRNMVPSAGWRSQDFDRQAYLYKEPKYVKHKNNPWESPVHASSGLPSARNNVSSQSSGSSCVPQEVDKAPPTLGEKQDLPEASSDDSKGSSERKENSRAKSSSSDTDTKRAKQQFAQRSRVRKLQYIAELERNVQALQVEESEVSAEIGFLNQQNLILSMENKTLKQRLESLAQEQLIKYMEHEVLEREIVRLRALHQQQQQEQQQPPQSSLTHQRSNSKDLDSKFTRLSLKHKHSSSS